MKSRPLISLCRLAVFAALPILSGACKKEPAEVTNKNIGKEKTPADRVTSTPPPVAPDSNSPSRIPATKPEAKAAVALTEPERPDTPAPALSDPAGAPAVVLDSKSLEDHVAALGSAAAGERVAAVQQIVARRPKYSIDHVFPSLDDPDPGVRQMASDSLFGVFGERFAASDEASEWWGENSASYDENLLPVPEEELGAVEPVFQIIPRVRRSLTPER